MKYKLLNSNKSLFLLISFILVVKMVVLFYMFTSGNIFGGGLSDANSYHIAAIGIQEFPNAWTSILSFLNDLGLYNRLGMSICLSLLAVFVIPFIVGNLALVNNYLQKQKVLLYLFFIVSIYPNIFLLSTDVFKDVFMLFMFLLGLYVFKSLSVVSSISLKIFLFILGLIFIYILYNFRPYLGFSYGVALMLGYFYSFKKYPLILSIVFLLLFLQVLYMFGFLDSLVNYREGFHTVLHRNQGSGIGISFDSSVLFIPKFIQSFIYQMFGFYFPNFSSTVVFVFESVPFMIALYYLIRNREYCNKFVYFLIVFFVVYATIWVIANDNLGTASRIRIFNYIVIYIACFVVYQHKQLFKNLDINKV